MKKSELMALTDEICRRAPAATASVYAKSLKTGEVAGFNHDTEFPAASVIKTCILVEVMRQASEGRFDLDDLITVDQDTGGARGSGILKLLKRPLSLSIYNLATLMIIVSDNTASNKCIDLVGFENVTNTCIMYGCTNTVLRRYFIGAAVDDRTRDNVITTHDLGTLLEKMYRGELVSPEMSLEMLNIMKRQTLNSRIPLHLPQGTVVAHKTGTQQYTAHDAGIVYGPAGHDYIISIAVTGVEARPTGDSMAADLSRAFWDYFISQ